MSMKPRKKIYYQPTAVYLSYNFKLTHLLPSKLLLL